MKRYYPNNEDKHSSYRPAGIRRISIDEWSALWREDKSAWIAEIRDRPRRFDQNNWQYAIREWRNEIPPETVAGGNPDGATGSKEVSPLAGTPFLVKDLFDVVGDVTGCSSRVLLDENGVGPAPAARNGRLVSRLTALGATVVGRSHMNEFAYGLDGRNSAMGDCRHPLSRRRIPGGSSSGSAWAVSAGVVPLALGTDTGGSIRLPAALCGVYGIRLSWSAEWLQGVFPLATSFDTVGWFTQTNADMQKMIGLVLDIGQPENRGEWKIGSLVPPGVLLTDGMQRIFTDVLKRIADVTAFRATVDPVSPDNRLGDEAVDAYNVIGSSEAWGVHAEWISSHGDLYDPVVRGLIERGAHWTEGSVAEAKNVRDRVAEYADELFQEFDIVVLPATVQATPTVEEADSTFRTQILRLNTLGSLAGLPALSLPVHLDAVRSGGIQVLAPVGREDRLWAFLELWSNIVTR